MSNFCKAIFISAIPSSLLLGVVASPASAIELGISRLGSFDGMAEGAAEISAYDAGSNFLFVTDNSVENTPFLDVLDISNPNNPGKIFDIPLSSFGPGVNSVATYNGIVAAAVEAPVVTDPGQVVFFDTMGNFLNSVTVGALPDMITFTNDGMKVLVANEGEADGGVDPEGSVSIIDLSAGMANPTVTTADFRDFNDQKSDLQDEGVRIFPEPTVAEDVEPEYITVNEDNTKAWVALQENNSLAILDLTTSEITDIVPLRLKDHSLSANPLDPSDRDSGININNFPVLGMSMPDGIASYEFAGNTYIISGNEGDARDEDQRIKDLTLDATAFPDAASLQQDDQIGRLQVSSIDGDTDGDGDFDQLYAYGSRSFSIWDSNGNLIWDSQDDFEQITALEFPQLFNADDGNPAQFDTRSDNKGPEPEGVAVGQVGDRTYGFIGLERTGGFMVYDITNPFNPTFEDYINETDLGDIGPEGLLFISQQDSPVDDPLLVVTNEVSGTTTLYSLSTNDFIPGQPSTPEPGSIVAMLGVSSLSWLKFKGKKP